MTMTGVEIRVRHDAHEALLGPFESCPDAECRRARMDASTPGATVVTASHQTARTDGPKPCALEGCNRPVISHAKNRWEARKKKFCSHRCAMLFARAHLTPDARRRAVVNGHRTYSENKRAELVIRYIARPDRAQAFQDCYLHGKERGWKLGFKAGYRAALKKLQQPVVLEQAS